jgi:hypothetical protein
MINKPKNIKEQIQSLKLPRMTRDRILELVIFAQSYDLKNDYSEFNLPQAFDWIGTREGGDYWLDVYMTLNKNFPENQNNEILQ